MNKNAELLTRNAEEILSIMGQGDFNQSNSEKPVERLILALTNHPQYLEKFPEDEWITEGYDLDSANPKCSEKLFSWALCDLLIDKLIIADKSDELCEAVIFSLAKHEIEIEAPEDELNSWQDYERHLNTQLLPFRKKIVTFDFTHSDDLSLLTVDINYYPRLLELVRFFNLRIIILD